MSTLREKCNILSKYTYYLNIKPCYQVTVNDTATESLNRNSFVFAQKFTFLEKRQKSVFLVGIAPTFSCAQIHVLKKPVMFSFVNSK